MVKCFFEGDGLLCSVCLELEMFETPAVETALQNIYTS
jgi:hypothetical protein